MEIPALEHQPSRVLAKDALNKALSLNAAQEVVRLLFPDGIPGAEVQMVSVFQRDVAVIVEQALFQKQLATGAAHGEAEEEIN